MGIQIPINLASEPFRRDRPMLVASAAVGALLILLLGVQVSTIVAKRKDSVRIQHTIDKLNAQLQGIGREQSKLNGTLALPENSEALQYSVFLNQVIDRKAISWTKIFADLEKVMPYNVRLVSVRLPGLDANNNVILDMQVGAKEQPPVIELVKHLEASPLFGKTDVQSSAPPSQTDPFYRYHITVTYAQKL